MTRRVRTQGPAPESFRTIRYDLLKEVTVALGIVSVVVVGLAAALSSPDVQPDTLQRWAQSDPVDFVTTATSELAGASVTAAYGPPYNSGSGSVQSFGPLHLQNWGGVHQSIDAANQFVLEPLKKSAAGNASLGAELSRFETATPAQQGAWLDAYMKGLASGTATTAGTVSVALGDYGPVAPLISTLLTIARSGGLDGLLLSRTGAFYQTDYTGPLLFLGDGGHLSGIAKEQHLFGNQWGAMNETGRYPGQAWLWLFTFLYQIPPYNTSPNVDLLVVLTMGVLSAALLLVPFIPGLRDIPRWIPLHRLIWRRFYIEERAARS